MDEFPTDRIPYHTRAYIYRVFLAALPILGLVGVLSGAAAPLIAAFVLAILGLGQASVYTSTGN